MTTTTQTASLEEMILLIVECFALGVTAEKPATMWQTSLKLSEEKLATLALTRVAIPFGDGASLTELSYSQRTEDE